MPPFPQCVLALVCAALCAVPCFAGQQPELATGPVAAAAPSSSYVGLPGRPMIVRPPVAFAEQGSWLFRHYGLGTYESTLGFGGRAAVSLTSRLNLQAGASYFSYSTTRSVSGIPFQANVRLQSEQAVVDWYPFQGTFHLSSGVLFGSSNRVYGGANIPAGNSFTLNGATYYSSSSNPIKATGSVYFAHTAPMLTVGWGNWARGAEGDRMQRHLMFPFDAGVAFMGDPATELNFSGTVCTNAGQQNCQNIVIDAPVQANIEIARKRLQNDANWLRFYPIIAGGIVYRF